jgi:hypothetical protein
MPAQSTPATPWQPARHTEDDWLDQVPGKHRLVFDTTMPDGFGISLAYSNNYLDTNKNAYGLQYSDVALVIVMRHLSTGFAFNDAMWAKYGRVFSQRMNFTDPKTTEPPETNLYLANAGGLSSLGVTLGSVLQKGGQLAVCRLATRALAGGIATSVGSTVDKINEELIANTVPNAHMVPAGIVALSRAQERGYTFAHGV